MQMFWGVPLVSRNGVVQSLPEGKGLRRPRRHLMQMVEAKQLTRQQG